MEDDNSYPKCNKCSKGYFVSKNNAECISNYCKGEGTDKKTFNALRYRNLGTRPYV